MQEYALLVANVFHDTRWYAEKPENIPHKGVIWYPVIREFGEPFTGVEGGAWVVRTVDPALVLSVPYSITPRQCRLLLLQQGLLDTVEGLIAGRDKATKITWEYALEFKRDDPLLIDLGVDLGLTSAQIDQFFIAAAQL